MLRWNGAPEFGAVRVDGGADQVMLPRLPNDEPPPARASASTGARISASAVKPASRKEVRRRTLRFFVIMPAIWCRGWSSASQGHPFNTNGWCIGTTAKAQVVGGCQVGEHLQQVARDGDLGHGFGEGT